MPSLRSTRTSEWTFWTFLDLRGRVALLQFGPFRGPCWVLAARACWVPSARRGGGLLPRGGVRARAPGGAHLATFAGAIFWLERWSGSQSACAVAGAGARARPGGGLPTLSEPVAEPSSLGRRHSRDNDDHIDVVLTNTLERRAAYPSTCAQLAGAGCAPGAGRPCPFCGGRG